MRAISAFILMLLLTAPAAAADTVTITPGVILHSSAGGGDITVAENATATQISLSGGLIQFTGFTMNGTTYTGLSLSASSNVALNLTSIHTSQLILRGNATTATEAVGVQSTGMTVNAVYGVTAWSGTSLAAITPANGASIITVIFNSGSSMSTAIILLPVLILGIFLIMKRRR
jgi:hypothetical protein